MTLFARTHWFTLGAAAALALSPLLVQPVFAQKGGSILAAPQPDQSPAQRSAALKSLLDEIWQDRLQHHPELATSVGDNRYNDRLEEYSATAYNAEVARDAEFLTRLAAIDTTGLSAQGDLSKNLMVQQLVDKQAEAAFKPWEMPVNQFSGIQVDLPDLQSGITFNTVKDYDDYIARLRAVPEAFQQVTNSCDAGINDGRTPPKFLLQKVFEETQEIANQKPEDSPFARPLAKFPTGISPADQQRIRTDMLAAITKQVLPAYVRFARYLQGTYIPAGRAEPGVWSLSDGSAYYAFLVKQSTTTDLTPAQIHTIGEQEVVRDETDMLAIAKKLGFPSIAALRASVATNPKLHVASRDALLDVYRKYLDAMKPKLPEYFGLLPKASLIVKPVPSYAEKEQAPAYYNQGTPDGSRPGMIYINTYDFAHRSLANAESIAYHEGIPGHHLQISIAQEQTGLPDFRKHIDFTAYTEGWGLYSERLGKDMGFYQDPYSDYGRLETDIFRAVRLVVDTGVHSQHWSRQQMIDYFHAHTGLDEATVQAETDRYIAWPAQALGYKIGQLQILKLRGEAQQALGPKFSYKGFHDVVLGSGALPMDVLADQVHAWIKAQGGTVPANAAEGAGK